MEQANAKGISQEGLKILACITMLLDHIGATLAPQAVWLRGVGRLAFPIYCYLLTQGAVYTRSPGKYFFRLAVGAVLSELPFDYAFWGGVTWAHQSVMVTLLLGLAAVEISARTENLLYRVLIFLPWIALGELLSTDYGGWGVAMIGVFWLTEGRPCKTWLRVLLLTVLCWMMPSFRISFLGLRIPIEVIGVLAMLPVSLASGNKLWKGKGVQWAFYLFYPVHLAVLALLERL